MSNYGYGFGYGSGDGWGSGYGYGYGGGDGYGQSTFMTAQEFWEKETARYRKPMEDSFAEILSNNSQKVL